MSTNSCYPIKFLSQSDRTLSGDTYCETEPLISDQANVSGDFSAGEQKKLIIPELEAENCLEADSGLYSKFKNTHVADEYSIYDQKGTEEKHSFISNSINYGLSEASLGKEAVSDIDSKKNIGIGFMMSILATVFTSEFAGALEIVYITPYFLKVKLNEWIDATIWMVPLLFITLLKAPISILARHRKYQRPVLFILMWMFMIGCVLFTYIDEFTLKGFLVEERRTLMTWLGILAFCFIDVANEMVSVVQNKIIEENIENREALNIKISIVGSFAKMFGYFCGSLQALRISYSQIFERNMDTNFLFAGSLMFVSMILCYTFQSPSIKGYQGSLWPKFKSLKLSHFLPSFTKVLSSSPKMKLILLSHFFATGSIVMLSVYATSWVAQDVLRGNPIAKSQSTSSGLFDVGVSWGSLGLAFTSVIILFTSYALHRMLGNPQKTKFKLLHLFSQLLSSLALFSSILLADLDSVFLVIPLTGLAFQTFHAVPEILAELLETEEGITVAGTYRRLLDTTFFYAQVLMWLVIPLIFVFFPNRDDNQWGMLAAASSGLASVLFTLFI